MAGTWSVISFEASLSGRRILPTLRVRPTHQRTVKHKVNMWESYCCFLRDSLITIIMTNNPAPAVLNATQAVWSGLGGLYTTNAPVK